MRKALLATTFALLVALGGCLDYDEVLSIAADGSGDLKVEATVDLAFADKLLKLSVPEGEKPPEDLDDPYKMLVSPQEIAKNVQGVNGVTVKDCVVEDMDGAKKRVKVRIEFKSLDALRKTTGFQNRELTFVEKDGEIEATYKVDASILKDLGLLADPNGPKPDGEIEKKMRKVVDDATADGGARFTVHFPAKAKPVTGKAVEGSEKAVRIEVPKKDPKAHAALAKDPIVLKATFEKKGNEVLLKKPEPKEEKKVAPRPRKEDE